MQQFNSLHIAIIMDGNGRWAEAQQLPRVHGHQAGLQAAKRIVKACLSRDVPMLSLFAFSHENWLRPADEVDCLMTLFVDVLQKEIDELNENSVRLRFIGDRTPLMPHLQQLMQQAEERTKHNNKLTLNIAINYSGKWDILHAAKALIHDVVNNDVAIEDINEVSFGNYLSTQTIPEPDLLIRTSGEQRISNFFLWQLAYTELYFTQTLWPDFDADALDAALSAFHTRDRRFGKLEPGMSKRADAYV